VTTAPVHDVPSPEPRTVCVLEDVSERVAAEREREELLEAAEDARREAEAANQAKNEFLAVMSHELRTPLNAIGGYAQLIELGIRGPVTDAQRADIDRIKRSQAYLLSLINDVLNFARIEAGHLKVEVSDVDIGLLVAGMRDFVQPQLRERKLTYTCDCPPSIRVRADPEKVQQILINLLTNALKFTPAGGTISMRCETTEDEVIISVCDTGRGISPDKLDSIFEPFVQVNRRYTREQEGIGLGLAISRELARAMGGEISVRSSEEEGSEFTLKLARRA
jgi:signal transduction histidine kinase